MLDFQKKKYNDFDYEKLVWVQDKLNAKQDISETDSAELMRWIDARIFHNLLVEKYFLHDSLALDLRIDLRGEEYDNSDHHYSHLNKTFRTQSYCVETRGFAKGLCRALSLPSVFFWTGDHAFSTVEIGKRRYIIDPTIGQFFTEMDDFVARSKFLKSIIWNGFIEETEENKKLHAKMLGYQNKVIHTVSPLDGTHNNRTPKDILKLRKTIIGKPLVACHILSI